MSAEPRARAVGDVSTANQLLSAPCEETLRRLPSPGLIRRWVLHSEPAAALFADSPLLFALLVDAIGRGSLDAHRFYPLIREKRGRLLELVTGCHIGEPRSALKFLGRLLFESLLVDDLVMIGSYVTSGDYRRFRHWQSVPVGVLRLVRDQPLLGKTGWLADVESGDECESIGRAVGRLLTLADAAGLGEDARSRLVKTSNKADFFELVDIYRERKIMLDALDLAPPFPSPPFAGNARIRPIATVRDLYVHGELQSNCVMDYVSRIYMGEYYIYQVLGDASCTLGISLDSNGKFEVDQMERAGNRAARESDRALVWQYLLGLQSGAPAAFDHHRAWFRQRQLDQVMSDYHAYRASPDRARRSATDRIMASYKVARHEAEMNAYAAYLADLQSG